MKLKAILMAQVAQKLNTDGANSDELDTMAMLLDVCDDKTYMEFKQASVNSFRRFIETAMTLIELTVGDMGAINKHEPSKARIASFLAGRITRHELYYGDKRTVRLRGFMESGNVRNDLTQNPQCYVHEVLASPCEITFAN
ncbi:MAG: hypothetical protein AAB337_01995 [Patescibacteria group bacterium]